MDRPTRQTNRIPVQIPVIILPKERQTHNLDGEVLNISVDGAFLVTKAPIAVGQELLVKLQFADAKVLEAKVVEVSKEMSSLLPESHPERTVVRWNSENMHSGYGVQFIGLREDTRYFLEQLIRYYENLSKAGVSF
jgi:hypothetical protein